MSQADTTEREAALGRRVSFLAAQGVPLDALNHLRTHTLLGLLLGPERAEEARLAVLGATEDAVGALEQMRARSALMARHPAANGRG